MAETTNFVSQINIDGTICEIKDSVARTNATNALNKATELERLPRVTVTYGAADTTIKVVTTNTHETA